MSRGLGWVQTACLERIQKYEEAGDWPTTYNITADVYEVKPDKDDNRWVSDAHTSLSSVRSKACSARAWSSALGWDGRVITPEAMGAPNSVTTG